MMTMMMMVMMMIVRMIMRMIMTMIMRMMLHKVASRWMTAVPTLPRESTGAGPSSWGNNYLINKLIANGGNIDLFPEFNGEL